MTRRHGSALAALVALALLSLPIARGGTAEFKPIETGFVHTTMGITEDGAQLLIAHQAANQVAVWDVRGQKITHTLKCSEPRFVLCRGGKAYVANYGKGTITVFDRSQSWALVNELLAGGKEVKYLTAPGGKYFKNIIVACCGPSGRRRLHLVDVARDKVVHTASATRHPIANWSYDGENVVVQGEFRVFPGGVITSYPAASFLRGSATGSHSGEHAHSPLVYQVSEGPLWFSRAQVYSGIPPRPMTKKLSEPVIPDVTRPVYYSVSKKTVATRLLSVDLHKLASQPVKLPAKWTKPPLPKGYGRIDLIRFADNVFYYPVAATHGDKAYLFDYREMTKNVQQCIIDAVSEARLAEARKAAGMTATGPVKMVGAENFPKKVKEDKPIEFQLYADEVTGTFTVMQGPKGVTVSPEGVVKWTPTRADRGEQNIKIKAVVGGAIRFVRLVTEVVGKELPAVARAGEFPKTLTVGEAVEFLLYTRKVKGAFSIASGPRTISLTPEGELRWTPSDRDKGRHHIRIKAKIDGKTSYVQLATEVKPREIPGGVETALDEEGVHYIDSKWCVLATRLRRDGIFVLTEKTLVELDAGALKTVRSTQLSEQYVRIAERPDYYLAATSSELHLLEKSTLKPKRKIKLPGSGLSDLAIHPKARMCYVAITDNEGGRLNPLVASKVAWVDETRGEVQYLDRVVGDWVAVHPSGRHLFTAVHEMYREGYRWDRVAGVMPSYGNVDILLSYDISGSRVRHRHTNASPGANSSAMRMSPDGAHVAIVAGGGYRAGAPGLTGYTIAAFNASDIRTATVSYKTGAYPRDVSFHPSLPLVAGTGGGTPSLFNRKTGEALADKIDFRGYKLSSVRRVFFTPDGKRLLVESSDQKKRRALRSFALRLSAEEQQQLEGAPTVRPLPELVAPERHGERPAHAAVPLADLDGLRGARAEPMDTRGIARAYTDAVVIIKSGEGGGTGFLIGSKGYVLTCAHVVPVLGDPEVSYRSREGGRVVMQTAKAEVIATDQALDLALLKIRTARPLPVVRLDAAARLEVGEAVSTIGHPGLGRKTLDYTMTQGIISNRAREIDGRPYIQTTAAVNPGSSGSPLFDGRGNVIGLVVLKANIESTGFAVPVSRLVQFMKAHAKGGAAPAEPREPVRKPTVDPAPIVEPKDPAPKTRPAIDAAGKRKCQSWLSMAKGFAKAGKKDKAREYLERIIQEYPGSDFAVSAQALLGDL